MALIESNTKATTAWQYFKDYGSHFRLDEGVLEESPALPNGEMDSSEIHPVAEWLSQSDFAEVVAVLEAAA